MLESYKTINLSVVASIYVIYILNFFKTRYSLAHPYFYFENKLLYHPIGKSKFKISNICKLGNYGAYIIALFILVRMIIILLYKNKKDKINFILKITSLVFLIIVFLLSLINFNALVYLIPYFIIEIYIIVNLWH